MYEFHTLLHYTQNRDFQGLGLLCNLLHWTGLKVIGLWGSLWLSVGAFCLGAVCVWVRAVRGSGGLSGAHRTTRGRVTRLHTHTGGRWQGCGALCGSGSGLNAGGVSRSGWLALGLCGGLSGALAGAVSRCCGAGLLVAVGLWSGSSCSGQGIQAKGYRTYPLVCPQSYV